MLLRSSEKIHVGFTDGTACSLAPGETKDVPQKFVGDLIKLGAEPVQGEVVEPEPVLNQVDPKKIKGAIEQLLADGDTTKFDSQNTPKVGAVSDLVGEKVTKSEIVDVWDAMEK